MLGEDLLACLMLAPFIGGVYFILFRSHFVSIRSMVQTVLPLPVAAVFKSMRDMNAAMRLCQVCCYNMGRALSSRRLMAA